jgi:hypothetical protein
MVQHDVALVTGSNKNLVSNRKLGYFPAAASVPRALALQIDASDRKGIPKFKRARACSEEKAPAYGMLRANVGK